MDERSVCAAFAERTLDEVRQICGTTNPDPASLDRASRLADLVHNIPQWLIGRGIPQGSTIFDRLEDFAPYTGCEDLVAREFEAVGEHDRVERLRAGIRRQR